MSASVPNRRQRQRASQLADLVREVAGPVDEAVKWGRLTFTVDDD